MVDLILNILRAIRAKLDQHGQKFDHVITRAAVFSRGKAGFRQGPCPAGQHQSAVRSRRTPVRAHRRTYLL